MIWVGLDGRERPHKCLGWDGRWGASLECLGWDGRSMGLGRALPPALPFKKGILGAGFEERPSGKSSLETGTPQPLFYVSPRHKRTSKPLLELADMRTAHMPRHAGRLRLSGQTHEPHLHAPGQTHARQLRRGIPQPLQPLQLLLSGRQPCWQHQGMELSAVWDCARQRTPLCVRQLPTAIQPFKRRQSRQGHQL
eukprot:362360-Chlamydomonas_euryale.AAC.7